MEIVIVVLLIILIGLLLWYMLRGQQRWREQADALTKTVGEKVEGSIGVFGEVRERLGELSKSTRNIEEVGKSIASLQEALRAPKFRGGFGELGLETLLANILPRDSYALQKKFRNGEVIVDAVVKIGNTFVPIDSKFPFSLEDFARMVKAEPGEEQGNLRRQFARTVKKHVDNVAKYILPDENTFDFALMYIPAENIYYETIVRDPRAAEESSLYSYCCERHVFPVSPNTFYAYLQAIVLGLRGLRIESSAREILGRLERLKGDFNAFQRDYETLGTHVHRAATKYDEASTRLTRLGDKLQLAGDTPVEQLPERGAETPDNTQ